MKPPAPSLAAQPLPWGGTNLSSLFHDGGVGCGVALGGADEPTGAQEAKAGGGDIPRGDLVLAWVPSAHAATHRAGRRERVGLPKATTVESEQRRTRDHQLPSRPFPTPRLPGGTPPWSLLTF